MIGLRSLAMLAVLTTAAHADVVIAQDPPPPQPQVIVAQPPPPPRPRVRPLLGDRWTVSAQTGVAWMQIRGTLGGGTLIQPALTRTFDRLELAASYTALDWIDKTRMRPSGTVHRLGAAAHYQAGRVRVQRKLTLDLVGTAEVGLQHFVPERGPARGRADFALGVLLRNLGDLDDREPQRLFFGMELGAKLLMMPRTSGDIDLGVIVAFGVPIGW